jgi:hypothetical protein
MPFEFQMTNNPTPTPYCILEHRHRYAAWAASRASSTKTCRFDVNTGKRIIEAVGLPQLLKHPDLLPSCGEMDVSHNLWREAAIQAAARHGLEVFGHGVAAKLINVYLKGAFVCGGSEMHERVMALHPPIDSLLLEELYANDVGGHRKIWAKARKLRWSKFTAEQYQEVINGIRASMGGRPLWQIEQHWRGYQ